MDPLLISLLKQINQYLLQILVITTLIIVFNLNEITSCMDLNNNNNMKV